MPDDAAALIDLATAISDGAPVNWPSVQSSNISEADRAVLQHLRVIAEIVSLQQRLASQPVHTSVVDELRQEAPRAPDARETLPSWGPLRLIRLVNARGDQNRGGLFRIDVHSGAATMVVPSGGVPRQSAWFRDGKAILYWDVNVGPNAPIIKRNLQTDSEQLVHSGGDFAFASGKPDPNIFFAKIPVPIVQH